MKTFQQAQRTLIGITVLAFTPALAEAQGVPWRHNYQAARREAQEKQLPLLLDFGTENCYWCKRLDASTFRDPAIVQQLSARFIPVKIDADREVALTQGLGIQSYPTLVFTDAAGKVLGMHVGYADSSTLHHKLQDVLARMPAPKKAPETPVARVTPPSPARPAARLTIPPFEQMSKMSEKAEQARQLMSRASEDYESGRFLCCLERCRIITSAYRDLPEAEQARQLTERIKNDPEKCRQACGHLSEALATLWLSSAEACLAQDQTQQAIAHLQRIVQVCPETACARTAETRLGEVRRQLAARPSGQMIRAQSPE